MVYLVIYSIITILLHPALEARAYALNYEFKSQLDKFNIEVVDGRAFFENTLVDDEPFAIIQQLFETKLADPCVDKLGKSDLTISREGAEKRIVYIKARMVSDGANCANIKGQGLYALPLHRNWFTGAKKSSIQIKNSFRIVKDGRVVVEYEMSPIGWRSRDPHFFTNWVFFEKFLSAIKQFPINYRVHEDAIKTSTTFELIANEKKYLFALVGARTWAVKMPNTPWLVASSNFGIFEDMSQTIWISPYDKTLRMISDTTANTDKRHQAIASLTDNWGPDVKYAFHSLLLNSNEDVSIRKKIVSVLRNYPSDENFKVLVLSLNTSNDNSFLYLVTKTLRVRNPNGPVIQDEDTPEVTKQKISEWVKWSVGLKK